MPVVEQKGEAMTQQASKELMDMIYQALASELQGSIQYMWHHIATPKEEGSEARKLFRKIAMAEMEHAEEIAEAFRKLGGELPTQPDPPVIVGKTIKEMIEMDIRAEEGALELYPRIAETAKKEGLSKIQGIFEDILSDEKEHYKSYTKLLEKLG